MDSLQTLMCENDVDEKQAKGTETIQSFPEKCRAFKIIFININLWRLSAHMVVQGKKEWNK